MKKLSLLLLVAFVFFCAPAHEVKATTKKTSAFKNWLVHDYYFTQSGHDFHVVVSTSPPPSGHVVQVYVWDPTLPVPAYVAASSFGGSGTALLSPDDSTLIQFTSYQVTYGESTWYLEGDYYPS